MQGEKKAGHFRIIDYPNGGPARVRWYHVRYKPYDETRCAWWIYDVVLAEGDSQARVVKTSKRELTDEMWQELSIWY